MWIVALSWAVRVYGVVRRAPPVAILALAALLVLADGALVAHSVAGNPYWRNSTDFGVYMQAAHAIASGHNPYNQALYPATTFNGVVVHDLYAYPPFMAEVLILFGLLGDDGARGLWLLISLGAVVGTFVLLLRGFGPRVRWDVVALCIALFGLANAVRNDLYHGQVNFVLLFLLTLGLWLAQRDQKLAAGILWGVVFSVKPFLGLLLVIALWRREWWFASVSVCASAAIFIVSFMLTLRTGLATFTGWIDASRYDSSGLFAARPDNLSLTGVILRFFTANPYTTPFSVSPGFAQGVGVLLLVTLLALLLIGIPALVGSSFVAMRQPIQWLLAYGLALGLSMVYGPLTEGDHLALLLPGLVGVVLWAQRSEATWRRWRAPVLLWALLFVYALFPFPIPNGVAVNLAGRPLSGILLLLTAVPVALLLAAFVALLRALWQERAEPVSDDRPVLARYGPELKATR